MKLFLHSWHYVGYPQPRADVGVQLVVSV